MSFNPDDWSLEQWESWWDYHPNDRPSSYVPQLPDCRVSSVDRKREIISALLDYIDGLSEAVPSYPITHIGEWYIPELLAEARRIVDTRKGASR